MQKIPSKWYKIIQFAIGAEMLLLIGAYTVLTLTGYLLPDEVLGLNTITVAICGVVVFQAFVLSFIEKKYMAPRHIALVTHVLASFALVALFQFSGDFSSPWFFLWTIAIFTSGAFGPAIIGVYFSVVVIYLLFIISGTIDTTTTTTKALIFVGADALTALVSFLFWRHLYVKNAPTEHSNQLAAEQIKSEIVINSIADGVLVVNSKGKIILFNPSAQAITGWKGQDALGLNYASVLKIMEEDKQGATQEVASNTHPIAVALDTRKSSTSNSLLLATSSGKNIEISLAISAITVNDTLQGAVAVFRDVSEARREERQRAEFISTASHEMRTPVAAIEGYLALALNEKVAKIDSKARDYLEKAHESTRHLGELFKDLLTAAKSEDGRLTSHPVVVDLNNFLTKVAEDVRFTVEKKGLQLVYAVAGDNTSSHGETVVVPLMYIHVDPERLREVVTNLVNNAVKFTEEGTITIGLRAMPDYVQISVRDTGFGIPPEDVPHLFQKFYRVDNTNTRSIGGTGLGLFICRNIIEELYHGKIWVESEWGQGSTFYINLPRLSLEQATNLKIKEDAEVAPMQTNAQL